jgi:hypothetical protein
MGIDSVLEPGSWYDQRESPPLNLRSKKLTDPRIELELMRSKSVLSGTESAVSASRRGGNRSKLPPLLNEKRNSN